MRKRYVLSKNTCIKEWTLTSEENYNAQIINANEMITFSGDNGFECTEDVLVYIEEYLHISRGNIIIK